MKQASALFIFLIFISVSAFAQYGKYGRDDLSTLSIFSENGERFFLVLNGVNQNSVPTSRIRVEGLPEYGNDIQLLFVDNATPAIRRNINIADPVDGKAVNMTLKVARNREGYARLKFFKCSEIERNYKPMRDEYVMCFGKPQQLNTFIEETTYVDNTNGRVTTQTTTTTTNNSRHTPPPPPLPMAMDMGTFNDAKQSIANASFEDTKLSTARTILGSNYVNTTQVMEICSLFGFEETKLNFAKFAYSRTVDQNSYFKVAEVFGFDASKRSLNDFISKGRR